MNKKAYILILLLASVLLTGCTPTNSFFYAYERGDCLTNRFEEVNSDLDIQARWKYDTLYLEWDAYDGDEFSGYYLVKEQRDTCPFYFRGGDYEEYVGKKSRTYYKDDDVVSGETYYYRVCVEQKDRKLECGAVEKISIY